MFACNHQDTLCKAHRTERHPTRTDGSRKALGLGNRAEWLGDLDSNQGCPGQSREFYR